MLKYLIGGNENTVKTEGAEAAVSSITRNKKRINYCSEEL